jgi:hypothetical protein
LAPGFKLCPRPGRTLRAARRAKGVEHAGGPERLADTLDGGPYVEREHDPEFDA